MCSSFLSPMGKQRVVNCSMTLVLAVLPIAVFIAVSYAHAATTTPIRGSEDLHLNCPSITDPFPLGSVKCEACRAVSAQIFHQTAVDGSGDAVDAVDAAVCEKVYAKAELRQRRNGRRYFFIDKVTEEVEAALTKRGGSSPKRSEDSKLTFHTAAEQNLLPCANYMLRRFCYKMLEDHEDVIETCVTNFMKQRKVHRRTVATSTPEADKLLDARRAFQRCLEYSVCEGATKDCAPPQLSAAILREREAFMKYEGAFGSAQLKFVEDENTPGLLVKNPFAPGGERASENEYLRPDSEL